MRSLSQTNRQSGFTLIEMLVVAPLVILIIGTFVGVMVSLVGDILVTRDRSAMTYETQDALNRIEQDVRLSTQFLTTTGALTAPQGSSSNFTGAAAFTNGNNQLILSTLATTTNPADTNKSLVYYANQPNACGTQQSYNRVMLMQVIYFIKDNSLWRRTILPNYNTNAIVNGETVCNAPWQRNTCSPGYVLATRCQTNDTEVMKNISSLNIKYYLSPGSTTEMSASSAKDALTMEATINGSKTTAGQNVATAGTMRATRLNNIDTSIPPPTTPTLSHTFPSDTSAKFSWSNVTTATSYEISYNINGGSWVNSSLDTNTTSFTVNGNREDTITFKVAAKNVSGTSTSATDTATLPSWSTFTLDNNWVDYNTTSYQTHGFTRTSAGVVMLKGIIKNGTTGTDIQIGTLPPGYRPTSRLTFVGSTYTSGGGASDSGPARVAIFPDGRIVASEINANWFTLDGIAFRADDSAQTWVQPGSLANGWTNYGGVWQSFRIGLDSVGRVHTQGTIVQGTIADTTTIYLPTAGYRPQYYNVFSAKIDLASGSYGSFGAHPTSGIVARSTDSAYLNSTAIYWPNGAGTWTTVNDSGGAAPAMSNGWARYSTTFNPAGYIKGSDKMVSLRGLIKNGTNANGETIFTLPAGYRPAKTTIFVANRARSYGRVDVLSDGRVIVRYASATWTSLDGINFIAEQ